MSMITMYPEYSLHTRITGYGSGMTSNPCSVDSCTKNRQAHGKCKLHAEEDTTLPRCTFTGCDRTERSKGLCFGHYGQKSKGRPLAPIVTWSETMCRGPLCDRSARFRSGYCQRHHEQMTTHGEVWTIGTRKARGRSKVTVCVSDGCTSTEIAVRCRCLKHAHEDLGKCWLPWCTNPGHEYLALCDEHRSHERAMRHSYGISWQERLSMSEACAGKCQICGHVEDLSTKRGRLHVDHDHETGSIRGLLCGPCNRAIGLLRHNPVILSSAINYLRSTDQGER